MEMLALACEGPLIILGLGLLMGAHGEKRRGEERLRKWAGVSSPACVPHHNVLTALSLETSVLEREGDP